MSLRLLGKLTSVIRVGSSAVLGVIIRQLSGVGQRGYKVIRDHVLSTSQSASIEQLRTGSCLEKGKWWWYRRHPAQRQPVSEKATPPQNANLRDTSAPVINAATYPSLAKDQLQSQSEQCAELPENEQKPRGRYIGQIADFYLSMWIGSRASLATGASSSPSKVWLNDQLEQPYAMTPNI